jgi:hypothetical protein
MALKSCDPFDVPVPADLSAMLGRMQAIIEREGGQFSGDATAGRFSGQSPVGAVEGQYQVAGGVVRVTIVSKPMLVPCSVIEERIRGYFK